MADAKTDAKYAAACRSTDTIECMTDGQREETVSSDAHDASGPGLARGDANGESRMPASEIRTRVLTGLAILFLMGLSAAGKAINTYGFFIYPDSYYYLLIARNIADHVHPAGTLGPGGMPFPPPGYAAMKATFPAIAAVLLAFGVPMTPTGHLVAGGAAVLAVPAAFWATRRLIDSRMAALTAAVLAATSFGITYWAGFIMSDSLSVLLAFVALALLAKSRRDDWSNAGDIAFGVVLALLLLSRPTYLVAVPLLAWTARTSFAWTRKRVITAGAAASFVVATIAAAWFPPSSFIRVVATNLLPVIGIALAGGAIVILVLRRVRTRPHLTLSPRAFAWLLVSLSAVIPAAYLVERVVRYSTGVSPYIGFGRFGARDPATIVLLIPGALAFALYAKRDVAMSLAASAVVLFGVYYWVEPRESRYLIHLLPFLIPIASAAPLLILGRRDAFKRPLSLADRQDRHRTVVVGALVALVALALFALGLQVSATASRTTAPFLRTAYPREVAVRVNRVVQNDDTVVTALPWPYYYHLGKPVWNAGVTLASSFLDLVPPENEVLVIADASMRYHYPALAKALEDGLAGRTVMRFKVPVGYQYGYFSIPDSKPVSVYRLSAQELSSALISAGLRGGLSLRLAPTEPQLR